ncbi:HNH endonuclease [Streptomyces sp. NPDC007904]|uniref:HNH endonuclease n=1 Tax=Streptomyces sp. NPDC007904 TaxID=3364787 RepID=UPI0036E3E190
MTSDLTPQRVLRQWLLTTLGELGGSAPTAQALREMERRYGSHLTPGDWEGTERDNEPKWHNRTRFERKKMEREGLLVPARESRGVWRLTETGSDEYRRYRGPIVVPPQPTMTRERSIDPLQPDGNQSPTRIEVTTQRIVRSTAVAEYVKRVHDSTCQICGTRLATPTGAYAEAAHIQPLGHPHEGPDVSSNVLCLCPNHHVLFDLGMLHITDDLIVIDQHSGTPIGRLAERPGHEIERRYLEYHRTHHGGDGERS